MRPDGHGAALGHYSLFEGNLVQSFFLRWGFEVLPCLKCRRLVRRLLWRRHRRRGLGGETSRSEGGQSPRVFGFDFGPALWFWGCGLNAVTAGVQIVGLLITLGLAHARVFLYL